MLLSPPINRSRFHAKEAGEKKPKKNYPNTSLSLKKKRRKKNRNHSIMLEVKKKSQQNISSLYTVALYFGKTQKKRTHVPISPLHCE
jgi:hypothetical protein